MAVDEAALATGRLWRGTIPAGRAAVDQDRTSVLGEPAGIAIAVSPAGVRVALAQGYRCFAGSQSAALTARAVAGPRADVLCLAVPAATSPAQVARMDELLAVALAEAGRLARNVLPGGRIEANDLGRALLLEAAREAVALEHAIGNRLDLRGAQPAVFAPRLSPVGIAAALLGLPLHAVPDDTDPVPEFPKPEAGRIGPEVALIDLYGLPDIEFHVSRLHADFGGTIVALISDRHSGSPHYLARVLGRLDRVVLVPLYGRAFDAEARLLASAMPQGASGSRAALLAALEPVWTRGLAVKAHIERLVDTRHVGRIVLSEHLSPASATLFGLASIHKSAVEIVAHSAWPLHPASAIEPPPDCEARFLVQTRAAGGMAAKRYGCVRVVVPPRLLPSYTMRRWLAGSAARSLRRMLAPRTLTLGVFLTSGQGWLAADADMANLATNLDTLAAGCAARQRRLIVRLRAAEDPAAFWQSQLAGRPGARLAKFHDVSMLSMARFLDSVDIVAELGHPTSAVLQAFAAERPVVRIEGQAAAPICPPGLIPALSAASLWDQIAAWNESGALGGIAKRQAAWLKAEVEPRTIQGCRAV